MSSTKRSRREHEKLASDFVALAWRAKEQAAVEAGREHLRPSRVNTIRLRILKQFLHPRGQKDVDSSYRRFLDCPQLREHADKNFSQITAEGETASLIDLMSIPYVYVPPAEWAVIALCVENRIPIEKGANDFSMLCRLMLKELNDPRADNPEAIAAFRRKIISRHMDWMTQGAIAGGYFLTVARKAYAAAGKDYLADVRNTPWRGFIVGKKLQN